MKIQLSISVSKAEASVLYNSLGLNDNKEYATLFELQDEYKQVVTFDAPLSWTVKYANVLAKLVAFVKNAIPLFKEYNEVAQESAKYITVSN
jgi:hypothetical protein